MPHQRFPKVQIIDLAPHEMRFILSDTDVSMANTLRRIMIAEVPTLAIDLVEFHDNSTVLNDEYIAHRLGLVPIRYQAPNSLKGGDCTDAFLSHRDCVCYERCPRCSVEFELEMDYDKENAKRPEGERDMPITITSRDLLSNNALVMPAHFLNEEEADESHDEGISIVKMGPGQKLKLKAVARMGISKEHAKWCPVAVATYRFWPVVTINEEQCATLTLEQKQELVDACPDRIIELDEVTGKLIEAENSWDIATFTEDLATAQKAMKQRPEDDDFVTVVQATDRFIFHVETTGAMDAEEIMMSSLKVLKEKLNYLAQEVENLKDL